MVVVADVSRIFCLLFLIHVRISVRVRVLFRRRRLLWFLLLFMIIFFSF